MLWKWKHWKTLTKREVYEILQLRQAIFIVEQVCPYLDADGEDEHCWHLCGYLDDQLVAYLRVFPPASERPQAVIGRVLTSHSIRGNGWGRPLMIEAEERANQEFTNPGFYLSAQSHLKNFYNSLGYEQCGTGYDEDGIPHIPMHKISKQTNE